MIRTSSRRTRCGRCHECRLSAGHARHGRRGGRWDLSCARGRALLGLPKLLALVKVPALADNASLGLVFLVGLLTSTHCIGMCGGILLAADDEMRAA
ncbi:MAG: sulfite exporter TauE/SafE family protein [Oscillospiraceae bacterium]